MVAYVFCAYFIEEFPLAVVKKPNHRQSNYQDYNDCCLHIPSLSDVVDLLGQFDNQSRIVRAIAVLPGVERLLN